MLGDRGVSGTCRATYRFGMSGWDSTCVGELWGSAIQALMGHDDGPGSQGAIALQDIYPQGALRNRCGDAGAGHTSASQRANPGSGNAVKLRVAPLGLKATARLSPGGRFWRPRRDLNTRPFAPQANALSKLSYEGTALAVLLPAEGGEGGIRTLGRGFRPRQALSRRPRSSTPAPPHALGFTGGGRGIRTPGGLPHSCFQDSRLRPLGHPSGSKWLPSDARAFYHGGHGP